MIEIIHIRYSYGIFVHFNVTTLLVINFNSPWLLFIKMFPLHSLYCNSCFSRLYLLLSLETTRGVVFWALVRSGTPGYCQNDG